MSSIVHISRERYVSMMNPMTFSIIVKLSDVSAHGRTSPRNYADLSIRINFNPFSVPLTLLTKPSFTFSAITLCIPPPANQLAACSTPRHVALISALASSALFIAVRLAERSWERDKRRERSGRDIIVSERRAGRPRYGWMGAFIRVFVVRLSWVMRRCLGGGL